MRQRLAHREKLPHAQYGVDLSKVPDYIEPFVAYRAWNWTADSITSLNSVPWTPGVAFEATCNRTGRVSPHDSSHLVPDQHCTCGMYAGINMQHLIDIGYIDRGIHGEVYLWGRLQRCTLGWRAQYAYPKYFVVPPDMLPFSIQEIEQRLKTLIAFNVDIYIQTTEQPAVGGEQLPLWMKDYGYSQQGLSHLIDIRKTWYDTQPTVRSLAVGDRVVVLGDKGGIGIVKHIVNGDYYYTLFNPRVLYRKPLKSAKWSDKNWRWETEGLGPCQTGMPSLFSNRRSAHLS